MISISMCMIVKNEQDILARCLDSYAGTYDELIIVDTGSTDNTKEIAAHYTDKIYNFEWINDFSAARNFAFSKAGCDYIFSADADEVLDDTNNYALRELKHMLLPEIDIVQMYYVNASEYNSVYNAHKELRPKLFKRLRPFTWISPIHETVRLTPIVYDSDIEILHMQAGDHSKRDFSTYFKAFEKGVHIEDYVVTMLCKELLISGEDSDFIAFRNIFENILSKEGRSNDLMKEINCILAKIYMADGDTDAFFKTTLKAVADNPPAEMCLILGTFYMNQTDYEEAVLWLYNAAFETESILDVASSGNKPLSLLGRCYEELAKTSDDAYLCAQYKEMSDDYYNQADNGRFQKNKKTLVKPSMISLRLFYYLSSSTSKSFNSSTSLLPDLSSP